LFFFEPGFFSTRDASMPAIATTGANKAAGAAHETPRHVVEENRKLADAGASASMGAARNGLQQAAATAGDVQRETARQAQGTVEFGQLFVKLFQEQARHGMQVAMGFGRTTNWAEIMEAQRDFASASFRRMNELNGSYRELVQAAMGMATAQDRPRKTA
jgi:hypothetical protein